MKELNNISKEAINNTILFTHDIANNGQESLKYNHVIKAQFFGNSKPHFWKINNLLLFVSSGSIVEVINKNETQIVQIITILNLEEYNNIERKYHDYPEINNLQEVIRIIKK